MSAMISAKEIVSEMEIKPTFHGKHVIYRKNKFDQNISEEKILSSEESSRINYFKIIVDQVISSIISRFGQFQMYGKILGFFFNLKKL